jgi:hypothetical protein
MEVLRICTEACHRGQQNAVQKSFGIEAIFGTRNRGQSSKENGSIYRHVRGGRR